MKLRTVFSRGVLVGTLAWGLSGCGDSEREPGDGGSLVDRRPIPGKCSIPAEGCPCTTDVVVKCGETIAQDGDTLTCRTGERTCVDGSWGQCAGAKTTQVYAPRRLPPGVEVQALATTAADCNDACDPYCQSLADTPEDVLLDDGLTVDMDGGLTLTEPGFTGSNCPDIDVVPATSTLTITTINADGTIMPDTVDLDAVCAVGGANIDPSWSIAEQDRAMIDEDGSVRVFSAIAGSLNVSAQSQIVGATGTGVVNVVVDVEAQTGLATPAVFNSASNTVDPGKTLYPYRETVFPLDLKAPLVQWQTGNTAATQVQISLRYPAGNGTPTFSYVHTVAGEPTDGTLETAGAPAFQIPQEVWDAFGRSAAGDTGEIVVQRYSGATLYNPMVIPVTFATEALRGTVYYTQYLRRLLKLGPSPVCEDSQVDLPENYSALSPGATVCPVGNCTHAEDVFGGSTTRAIDMSNPEATNLDPFEDAGGCPVCHSVSAQGNVYVAGSRYLQTWGSGTSTGFVNNIVSSPTGSEFSVVGEAGNYFRYRTETDWDSRGFSYAPLTPDGALALQGYYYWGNTRDVDVADNNTVALGLQDGGQQSAMFFVPTANPGPSVLYATTAALTATLNAATNELVANSGGALPTIDGMTLAVNDSVLVKNQADAKANGIYVVTVLGSAVGGGTNLTTSTTLTATASSTINATTSPASRAFDNDTNTRWESQWSDPQWVQVDLGSTQSVSRVVIDWEAASARTYTIQVSTDNMTWTTVFTVANNTNFPQHRIDDNTFTAVNARYVRMSGTVRNQTYGYSIWEMDVYGPGSGTPYKLTRRADARTPAQSEGSLKAGTEVRVRRGTANYGRVFRLTSHPATAPNVNVDNLTFTDINATPLTWPMMTSTISPDGSKLAYITGDADPIGADTTAWRKGVTMMDFNQANRTLTNKKRVINNLGASNNTLKWPFFEHDSRSLIVQESNTSSFCSSAAANTDIWRACKDSRYGGTAPTNRGFWPGRLHSIDAAAANPATTKAELSRLNDAEDPADADKAYQPTVLPFESGGYRWVVFTSPRSYGNQINQIGTHFTCGATMMWVAALDDATATATDRSHPAFFLPGQNVARIRGQTAANPDHFVNERGYLVPSPCKPNSTSCTTSDECCDGNCAVESVPDSGPPSRVCKAMNACSAVGDACLSSADCCGGSPCVNSECQVEPTYTMPATFTRVFEAECPAGFHPLWGLFLYHLTTPSSSHIEFSAETAASAGELDMADLVILGDSQADNEGMTPASVDVGEELLDDDVSPSLPFLRVHMTLHAASDGSVAPILHDWEQRYTCVPAE